MDFVILLSRHLRLGWTADPWFAEPRPNGSYRLSMRLASAGPLPETDPLRPLSEEMMKIMRSVSDQELTRRFGPKGSAPAVFLAKIDDELIKQRIRPEIDRAIDGMLRLALRHRVPVFLRPEGDILTTSMRLDPVPGPAEPWFCFTKGMEGSSYELRVLVGETPIDLRKKGTVILTDTPCWLVHEGRLIGFRDGFEGKKLVPFLTREQLFIPLSAEKQYFGTFILKTLKSGQVRAEGFKITDLEPERTMELSLESDWQGRVLLVTWYRYGDRRIMREKRQQVFTELKLEDDGYSFYRITRDPEWENRQYGRFAGLGLARLNDGVFVLPAETMIPAADMHRMVNWLSHHRDEIKAMGIRIIQEGPRYFIGNASVAIGISEREDWFDLHAMVRFGDLEIPFSQLRGHILGGIREFSLPGGEIAVIPEEWFSRYHDLMVFSGGDGESLTLMRRHFPLVRALDMPLPVQVETGLKELEEGPAPGPLATAGFRGTLRPYQSEGVSWMKFLRHHGFGGCLADDMGLGKTIQTLALLLEDSGNGHPASLIVMPASLIHNWKNETRRFAPGLRVMIHTGNQRTRNSAFFGSFDLILTTYGVCRNDIDLLSRYRFRYVILDESQVIKNPEALISRTVCSLVSSHRLVLTGTPIENSLTDLWSQMEFLNPGMLGSLALFRKNYVYGFDPSRDTDKGERLRKMVAPFILRRKKEDVEPDLPELSVEYRYCEMTEQQQRRYDIEKSSIRNELLSGIENGSIPAASVQVLKALIRLRQTACHPLLADRGYGGDSGKLDEVLRNLEILREEGQKVLIFSSFVEHLKILAGEFNKNGWPYAMLTGSTISREQEVEKFSNDSNILFFLVSLKAGGTGLNLTRAGYVFMLDPWWNPAAELQAINRAHRIGQEKKVIAYKFISKDSIEEKMLRLQERKQVLSDTFVPAGNPLKDLSVKEMTELLG